MRNQLAHQLVRESTERYETESPSNATTAEFSRFMSELGRPFGYFAYNFIKIHGTFRVTPAMAAGVTDRLWEVSDLVVLIEAEEQELERAA